MTSPCECIPLVGCPAIPDTWAETLNSPPALTHSPFTTEGTASTTTLGSGVTLQLTTEQTQPDPRMAGAAAAAVVLTDPVNPNEFAFAAQIDAAIMVDPPTFIGTPWSHNIDVAFGGMTLVLGEDGVTPFGLYGVSFHMTKQATNLVAGGAWQYSLTVSLNGSYRLLVGDPQQNEIDSTSGGAIHVVNVGPYTDQTFLAGPVVIDRSLSRGTLRFYYPRTGWLEYPITADLSTLADPQLTSALDMSRDGSFLSFGAGLNETTTTQSLSGVAPCAEGFSGSPTSNQPVFEEFVATGDGVTTAYATNWPYVVGSLSIAVAGMIGDIDATTPATGAFALADPAPFGASIYASYRAQGA
jgi:hypothetical protein